MRTSALLLLLSSLAACSPPYTPPAPSEKPAAPAADEDEPPGRPTKQPPPISGGTLAVMANGTIVAADPDRDVVWLLAAGETIARKVALQEGDEPGRVIEGPAGHAFIALRRAGAVADLELTAAKIAGRHPACAGPRGLAWSEPKGVLTVACATGVLARLSFVVGEKGLESPLRALQQPAPDLRDVALQNDGTLIVTTFRSARVFAVQEDGTPSAFFREVPIGDSTLRVAWRYVSVSPTGLTGRVPVGLLLAQSDKVTAVAAEGNGPASYAASVPIVDPSIATVFSDGSVGLPLPLRAGGLLVDVAMSAKGVVAVAAPSTGRVLILHGSTIAPKLEGSEPTAVAFRGEELVVFRREPAELVLYAPNTFQTTAIRLDGVSVASHGHRIFHANTGSALACASCHPEGGDDGHVWLLPEGQRRTAALKGGLRGTAPFHWSGDQRTMKALMNDVMVGRMRGNPPSDGEVGALFDWLDALPAPPKPAVADEDQVARGKALFDSEAVGCAACHPGALGTNNQNHDVGTNGVFQTPRLVGLAARAPYFHDGRVATLEERFGPAGGGDQHGHVSQLTGGEREDLIAYLRTR